MEYLLISKQKKCVDKNGGIKHHILPNQSNIEDFDNLLLPSMYSRLFNCTNSLSIK